MLFAFSFTAKIQKVLVVYDSVKELLTEQIKVTTGFPQINPASNILVFAMVGYLADFWGGILIDKISSALLVVDAQVGRQEEGEEKEEEEGEGGDMKLVLRANLQVCIEPTLPRLTNDP